MSTFPVESQFPPDIRAWLAKKRRLLIDGIWAPAQSGKTFEVSGPATTEVITIVAKGDKPDVELE